MILGICLFLSMCGYGISQAWRVSDLTGRPLVTPRQHSPKGDLQQAGLWAGWHLPLAARVLISRRVDARGGGVTVPPGRIARISGRLW